MQRGSPHLHVQTPHLDLTRYPPLFFFFTPTWNHFLIWPPFFSAPHPSAPFLQRTLLLFLSPPPFIPFIPLLFPHFFRLPVHSLPLLSLFLRIPRSRCAVCSTPDKTDRGGNANRVLAAAEMVWRRFESAGQGCCWFDTVFPCVTYMRSVRLTEHRLSDHIQPLMCYLNPLPSFIPLLL